MEPGYWDNEKFIYITEDDYMRWIDQGRRAYEVGNANFNDGSGAVHLDDKQCQLKDMICHMLHYGRLHGLINKHYSAEDLVASALNHFNCENPPRLRPWMKDTL